MSLIIFKSVRDALNDCVTLTNPVECLRKLAPCDYETGTEKRQSRKWVDH